MGEMFRFFVLFCVRGHCKSVFVLYKNTVNKSGSSDDLFYPTCGFLSEKLYNIMILSHKREIM